MDYGSNHHPHTPSERLWWLISQLICNYKELGWNLRNPYIWSNSHSTRTLDRTWKRLEYLKYILLWYFCYVISALSIPCSNHTGLSNSFCLCFVITCGLLLTIPVGLMLSMAHVCRSETIFWKLVLDFLYCSRGRVSLPDCFCLFLPLYTPS